MESNEKKENEIVKKDAEEKYYFGDGEMKAHIDGLFKNPADWDLFGDEE